MSICEGSRRKIKRADHHIAELESCIDLLKKRLIVSVHVDSDRGNEYIKCDFTSVDDRDKIARFAVIIGDAVHNLKCALDHVWLETVSRLIPLGDWRKAKFPVYPTQDELELALKRMKIDIFSPRFFRFIVRDIKPYDGGDEFIRALHRLDIRDKHRLLIPMVQYSSIGDIYLEDQNGGVSKGSTWGTFMSLPHFVAFASGIRVKDPGRASIEIMFEEGNAGHDTQEVFMLGIYSRHISQIVKLFEKFTES